jgi:hypothetical protein
MNEDTCVLEGGKYITALVLWFMVPRGSRPGVYYISDCTAGVKGLASESNLGIVLAYCFESLIYGSCFG